MDRASHNMLRIFSLYLWIWNSYLHWKVKYYVKYHLLDYAISGNTIKHVYRKIASCIWLIIHCPTLMFLRPRQQMLHIHAIQLQLNYCSLSSSEWSFHHPQLLLIFKWKIERTVTKPDCLLSLQNVFINYNCKCSFLLEKFRAVTKPWHCPLSPS